MGCCVAKGASQIFDEKLARRDARRYRRKGLDETARRIVTFLGERGVEGATMLEVGGGIGAIQLELLAAGASRSTIVELSPGYDLQAAELAREAGVADRIERKLLDFAEQGEQVVPADAVVMHRVVCCYPDHDRLVGAAADHARRVLVLSFPPGHAVARLAVRTINLMLRLTRREFRAYAHAPEQILAAAERRGLRTVFRHRGRIWHLAALERP